MKLLVILVEGLGVVVVVVVLVDFLGSFSSLFHHFLGIRFENAVMRRHDEVSRWEKDRKCCCYLTNVCFNERSRCQKCFKSADYLVECLLDGCSL